MINGGQRAINLADDGNGWGGDSGGKNGVGGRLLGSIGKGAESGLFRLVGGAAGPAIMIHKKG